MVTRRARRYPPKVVPYNRNARDADNDGVVQEGTIWERPAGARFVNQAGQEISSALRSASGTSMVDREGSPINNYVPLSQRGRGGLAESSGTGRVDASRPTISNQGGVTIGEVGGQIQGRPVTGGEVEEPDIPEPDLPEIPDDVGLGYRGQHQPNPSGVQGFDMEEQAPDIYDRLDFYMTPRSSQDPDQAKIYRETERALGRMRDNPDARLVVYRAVPKGVDDINNGDWVSVSETYARQHGEGPLNGEYNLIPRRVKASDLRWDGDYPTEFGYFPPEEEKRPWRPRKQTPLPAPFRGGVQEIAESASDWNDFRQRLHDKNVVVFDYESTDFPWNGGQPYQIGAVKMRNGEVVDRFNVFMDPEVPMDDWGDFSVENLRDADGNPVTQSFVNAQGSIRDAHQRFADWVGDDGILVAHNYEFDHGFLQDVLDDQGIDMPQEGGLDTLQLARDFLRAESARDPDPEIDNHKLGTLAEFFDIDLKAWHTADADADATAQLLEALLVHADETDKPADWLQERVQERRYQERFIREDEKYQIDLARHQRNLERQSNGR